MEPGNTTATMAVSHLLRSILAATALLATTSPAPVNAGRPIQPTGGADKFLEMIGASRKLLHGCHKGRCVPSQPAAASSRPLCGDACFSMLPDRDDGVSKPQLRASRGVCFNRALPSQARHS